MEYVPIGKRTRLQKTLNKENFLNNSGFSSSDDDDDDEDECCFIDETEFLKSISRIPEKNSAKSELGIEKNISSNLGRVYENHDEISKGLDDNAESTMNDDDDDYDDEEEEEEESVCMLVDDDDGNVGARVEDDDDGNDGVCVEDDDDGNDGVSVVVDDGNGGVSVVDNDDDNGSDGVGVDDDDNDNDGNGGARVDDDGNVGVCIDDVNGGVGVDDDVHDGVGVDDDGKIGVGIDDDEEEDDDGNGGVRVDDDGEVPLVKLPRRLFEGVVLPKYIAKDVEGNDFIGKRTRSHYKFRSKNKHHGTPSSPISIDIDDEDSSLSHDEEDHKPNSRELGEGKRKRGRPPLKKDDKVGLDLDEDEEEHFEFNRRVKSQEDGGGKRKRGRPPLKKVSKEDLELMKPKGKRLKTKEVQNVLLNVILENGKNAGLNNIASSFSEAFLPLKFKYGVEKLSVPEISAEEQEVESLFAKMDFALGVSDIGSEPSCLDKDDDEDDNAVLCDSALLQEKLCLKGKHYWIYDELIGNKCKFCSFLKLEIQYVTPEFNKTPDTMGNSPTMIPKFLTSFSFRI
ncbi:protein PFC0760c-like [Chenopodium quinoa]|uniref:protein PFC0760c-like n=1 Tax=Chenopodium quinoa TaxID=63459 RepID=UPI000B797FF4|nr:protein PFC0760c-like [Chenopodium quinoa]